MRGLLPLLLAASLASADDLPPEARQVLDRYAAAVADGDAEAMWDLYATPLRARVDRELGVFRAYIEERLHTLPEGRLDEACEWLDASWRSAGRMGILILRVAWLEHEAQALAAQGSGTPVVDEVILGATLCIARTTFPSMAKRTLRIGRDQGAWRILECKELALALPEGTEGPFAVPGLRCTTFRNWAVEAGSVDLIGRPARGDPLWQVLPQDGLYIDMVGYSEDGLGKLESKEDFAFEARKVYRFSIGVAGNQRDQTPGYKIRIRVDDLLDQTIQVDDCRQRLTHYGFEFTPASAVRARVTIEEVTAFGCNTGLIIDDVRVERVADGKVVLFDDFER